MQFFNESIGFKIRVEDLKHMDKIIKKTRDKYENRSHFVRSAVLKQIREEKGK